MYVRMIALHPVERDPGAATGVRPMGSCGLIAARAGAQGVDLGLQALRASLADNDRMLAARLPAVIELRTYCPAAQRAPVPMNLRPDRERPFSLSCP